MEQLLFQIRTTMRMCTKMEQLKKVKKEKITVSYLVLLGDWKIQQFVVLRQLS